MTFIDTHTHIYDEAFTGEEDDVIRRAKEAGVAVMLQPDVDSRERDAMFALVDRHPDELHAMLGLYPGSVDKGWRDEIDAMLRYRGRKVVALGEIGLDYHYGAEFAAEQREAFRVQMELAADMDLPVNIHLREATDDFFRIMDDCAHLHLRGSLHAYSGSYETFQRVRKYGEWYVGVGGVVTFKKASLAEAVKRIPLECILLETDSPYLTPVPHRGERNESRYIPLIAARIAELKGTGVDEVAEATTANARRLFNI
ncbi:MAG: TatD family hydrolase [Bacteroidales bacterium]|nr:TatD family hydrolase [Bacteroidales bacterium]MBR5054883.1 TatD family hydrolase [Bacteroidales bacterium]